MLVLKCAAETINGEKFWMSERQRIFCRQSVSERSWELFSHLKGYSNHQQYSGFSGIGDSQLHQRATCACADARTHTHKHARATNTNIFYQLNRCSNAVDLPDEYTEHKTGLEELCFTTITLVVSLVKRNASGPSRQHKERTLDPRTQQTRRQQ